MVLGYFTDGIIEDAINRWEGVCDTKMDVGNGTGALSFTYSATKAPHFVVEAVCTYGAALQLCAPSILSWNTLDQLINAQNTLSYLLKVHLDLLDKEESMNHIRDQ